MTVSISANVCNFPIHGNTKKSRSLDKLAQLRKIDTENSIVKLQKRAKSKFVTHSLTTELLKLDSPLNRSYWNTFYCASAITQNDTKFTSRYCKSRACLVCNRIRTAELINGYLEPLQAIREPYFLTLTKPTVLKHELSETIKNDTRTFRKILDRLRKRGISPQGIRKLECTYRPLSNRYHPHFHLIVETKEHAEMIQAEWLKEYPTAKKKAQDLRPCNDNSIKELMKYFTKLLPSKSSKDQNIYPFALDIIFQAMRNQRVYQPFGKIRKVKETIQDIITDDLLGMKPKIAFYEWEQSIHDWYDIETAEILSNYQPTDKDIKLITSITVKKPKP